MKATFKNEFTKSIAKLKDKKLKEDIVSVILEVESAASVIEIKNLKKLVGHQFFYRIRIGDYRIGLKIQDHAVVFAVFAHRKDIYKQFP